MENTLENKAKFFAQYFGQQVCYVNGSYLTAAGNVTETTLRVPSLYVLLLTPLSKITDEDAIEVSKYECWNYEEDPTTSNIQSAKNCIVNCIEYKRGATNIGTYQYLQSKGYALPFHNLSVDDLVKYGWVVLS